MSTSAPETAPHAETPAPVLVLGTLIVGVALALQSPPMWRPMLWYVLKALRGAGISEILVVVNDELQGEIARFDVAGVLQAEQLGTGHAVKIALEASTPRPGSVVVAYGDMPLVSHEIFARIVAALDGGLGHAIDDTGFFVLGDGHAALFLNGT